MLTDKGNVFWSGIHLAYLPVKWDLPANTKIVKVAASDSCFSAVAEDG